MLSRFPTKPCRYCGSRGHFPYQCFKNPKRKQTLKPVGKTTKQWLITRATWIRNNPPNHQGYWKCYMPKHHPLCPIWLDKYDLTLDHVVARSRDKSKLFDQDNLQPASIYCNQMKGSRKLDELL